MSVVFPKPIANVRPRGIARHTYPSDDLSLGDELPYFYFATFHVEVLGAVDIIVFDGDVVPIASGIGGFDHNTIGCGQNGSPNIGSKVGTAMRFDSVAIIGNSPL